MKSNGMIRAAAAVAATLGVIVTAWGRFLRDILFLSLADGPIAPAQCLVLQLEKGALSAISCSRFLSRIQIKGLRHHPFDGAPYPPPENLAAAAALDVEAFKARGAPVLLIVPKAWVILKRVEFPLAVKAHLPAVLAYELDRISPLSADRAFYDFTILAEGAEGIQILLLAVKTETLQPYLDALRARGVVVQRVAASLLTLGTLCHFLTAKGDTLFAETRPGGYEGGWVHDRAWRAFCCGSIPSGDEPAKVHSLARGFRPLVDGILAKGQCPELFVHPPLSSEGRDLLRQEMAVPVRAIDEAALRRRFSPVDVFPERSWSALGGILESLQSRGGEVNLLAKGVHQPSRPPRALSFALLALLAALGLFWLVAPLQIAEKRIAVIDQAIAARKDEVKQIEAVQTALAALEKEMAALESFRSSRVSMLGLLKELTGVLPGNAWLSRVRMTVSTAEIEGYAPSAAEIMPKLEASAHFRKVEFAAPTFRDVRYQADRFILKMEIEGLQGGPGKE